MEKRAYPEKSQVYKYALLFSILFILYSGMIPFDFYIHPRRVMRVIWRITTHPLWGSRWISTSEIVRNILLFMPLGFFFYVYFDSIKKRKFLLVKTLLFGILMSLGIEIAQLFFRGRVTSTFDFIFNSTGTIIGGTAALFYVRVYQKPIRRSLHGLLKNEPVTIIILLMIVFQVVASMIPFHMATSAAEIKENLKYCNAMPFGSSPLGATWGAFVREGAVPGFSWLNFFQNVLFYTFFGYLVFYVYKRYWKKRAQLKLFLLFILYFPVLEIMKIFFEFQTCDLNNIISGYLGVCIGVVIFYMAKKPEWFRERHSLPLEHFFWLFPVYLVFFFYSSWNPFTFSTSPEVIGTGMKLRNLLPFYLYFGVTSWSNTYMIFRAFFITMPLGAFLAARQIRPGRDRNLLFFSVLVGVLFGLIIEIGQMFIRTQTVDLTDVILAGLGCMSGVFFYHYYIDNFVSGIRQETEGVRDFKNEKWDEIPSETG
jgi:glycopeptide antibiotics resistance protein